MAARSIFANWMMVGIPLALLLLPICWLALTRWAFDVSFRTSGEGKAELRRLREELGPISTPEVRIAMVAAVMVVLWGGPDRSGLQLPGLAALDDSGIAIAGAILMFVIPSGDRGRPRCC